MQRARGRAKRLQITSEQNPIFDVKAIVLGYIQGGSSRRSDHGLMSIKMGIRAVEQLESGDSNKSGWSPIIK